MKVRSEQRCFDGVQGFYEHESAHSGPMRFSVYLPPGARDVPVVYWLSGLSCSEETFMIKGGAQRMASQLGLALVACDTSPRAPRFVGDDENWDFGLGAGFYVDATEAPWSSAYRMHSYVAEELPQLIEREFPIGKKRGICGHSMGGHGALTLALRHDYSSVSAFAPICAPSQVPWGQKAFSKFLGERSTSEAKWNDYDAVALIASGHRCPKILVDQGTRDQFLDLQLKPELLRAACEKAGQPLELRMRDGYDHSYYFVSTFMEDHLRHHAAALAA